MLLSTFIDVLYVKVQELGKQKYWFLYLGLIFIAVTLINGVAIVPEEPYQRLSQNPFVTRTDIHFNNYWQETLLLPLAAYYLDWTGTITFNALTFAIILGAYSLFAWFTYRRWGSTLSLIMSMLIITSPLSTVLLSWLGTPDGLTLALTIPFLFTYSGGLIFFSAILGATNHPAFIVAALEILILRWVSRDGINFRHVAFTIMGMAAGYGAMRYFLYAQDIDVVSRLDFMQLKTISGWIRLNLTNLPITLFSLFNIHWLIIPVCMTMFFKRDRSFFYLTMLILLANYGLVFFTLDTTRIFILISWGVLFGCLFHSHKLTLAESETDVAHQKQLLQALMLIGFASLFSPRFFSWVGEIHSTPFYGIIGQLLR